MKNIVIVCFALLLAVGATAGEKIPGTGTPEIVGAMDQTRGETFEFTEFVATGSEFFLLDPDPVVGVISSVVGDFVLNADAEGYTYCNDLTLLVMTAGDGHVLIQVGGWTDYGAVFRRSWDYGNADDAGTLGGGTEPLPDVDCTGYHLYLGNGYGYGGVGNWTGSIELVGSVVGAEATTLSGVKAMFD